MSACRPTVGTPTPPSAGETRAGSGSSGAAELGSGAPTPGTDVGCVAVAYSGGRDSTALLHATCSVARAFGLQVVALHVHHGLSPHADDWLAHCAAQCIHWRREGAPLTFRSERVQPAARRQGGTEAWARAVRHAALDRMAVAAGASVLLLAHHRQDQAETVVLQAVRGGGVAGWSAMPARQQRHALVWARPWLDRPRSAIAAYLAEHALVWIDDDSNGDRRHARNRLRLDVWPTFTAAFPHAEQALVASARRAQEAAACLDELAAIDLASVCPDGVAGGIDLEGRWSALSPPRRGNVLRVWLRALTAGPASASLIARVQREAGAQANDAAAVWRVPGAAWTLHRWRGRLRVVPMVEVATQPPARPLQLGGCAAPSLADATPLAAHSPGCHAAVGWAGRLRVVPVVSGGVALSRLTRVTLRARSGGERFQLGAGRPARSLKRQFQALAVPPWARNGPLVYDQQGALLYVPGLGIDARAVAAPDEPQAAIAWEPEEHLPGRALPLVEPDWGQVRS